MEYNYPDYGTSFDPNMFNFNAGVMGVFTILFMMVYFVMIYGMLLVFAGGFAGLSHMFSKANVQPFKAMIPFYNMYILFNLTWKKKYFWFYLGLVVLAVVLEAIFMGVIIMFSTELAGSPGSFSSDKDFNSANLAILLIIGIIFFLLYIGLLVFQGFISSKIAKAFGKGLGFACGIFFLQPIFFMILGFGSARYTDYRLIGNSTGYSERVPDGMEHRS